MICPKKTCRIEIDDDSRFCDQCGSEILVCPKCNTFGVFKCCPNDGTKLVSRKKNSAAQQPLNVQGGAQPGQGNTGGDAAQVNPQASGPQAPQSGAVNSTPANPVTPHQSAGGTDTYELNSNPAVDELIIVHSSGFEIKIKDKDLIGRKEGVHSPQLENFRFISRKHAAFIKNSGIWFLKDLGSKNKSRINGEELVPEKEYPVKKDDRITFADQEFTVK